MAPRYYNKKTYKRFILFFGVVLVFLMIPFFTYAEEDFFKVCWKKDDCYTDPTGKKDMSKYEFIPPGKLPDGDICKKNNMGRCYYRPSSINLQVKIPKIEGVKDLIAKSDYVRSNIKSDEDNEVGAVTGFPVYLAILYTYFVSAAGIVAVVMIAYGGYQWMIAGGNAEKISQAKSTIQGAIAGLVLALGSYVLLGLINSKLVTMKDLRVDRIKPIFLANKCIELKKTGIDDLISPNDTTKRKPDKAKCGLEYYSESNPDIQCMGTNCDDQLNKPYCIPDEEDDIWKCVSKEKLFAECNKIEDLSGWGGTIEDADYYLSQTNNICKSIDSVFKENEELKSNYACMMVRQADPTSSGGYSGLSNVYKNSCYAGIIIKIKDKERFGFIDCRSGPGKGICDQGREGALCVGDKYDRVVASYYYKCMMGSPDAAPDGIKNKPQGVCSSSKPTKPQDLKSLGFISNDYDYVIVSNEYCPSNCSAGESCWAIIGLTNNNK